MNSEVHYAERRRDEDAEADFNEVPLSDDFAISQSVMPRPPHPEGLASVSDMSADACLVGHARVDHVPLSAQAAPVLSAADHELVPSLAQDGERLPGSSPPSPRSLGPQEEPAAPPLQPEPVFLNRKGQGTPLTSSAGTLKVSHIFQTSTFRSLGTYSFYKKCHPPLRLRVMF